MYVFSCKYDGGRSFFPAGIAAVILLAVSLSAGFQTAAAQSGNGGSGKLETVSDLPRKARLSLFNARKAFEEEKAAEASRILTDFLAENPDNDHYIVRFYLGTYLAKQNRKDEAVENYRESVRLEPRFKQGWLNLGETAYQLELYDLASSSILEGFQLSSENRDYLLYYASAAYIMGGKPSQAADLLEKLVSGEYGAPKLEWYKALISCYLDLKAVSRGESAVRNMIDSYPDDPAAWKLAFQFFAGSGDYRQAAAALTIKGYIQPLDRAERIQLGDMYNAIGIPGQAGEYYSEAVADSSSARDFEKLASAYLAAYDYEAALETLKKALSLKPTLRLWSLLGDLHYMNGNHREAYKAFRKCVEFDSDYGRAYLMMGYCALENGDVEAAVRQLHAAAQFTEQKNTALKLLKKAETLRE